MNAGLWPEAPNLSKNPCRFVVTWAFQGATMTRLWGPRVYYMVFGGYSWGLEVQRCAVCQKTHVSK